MSVKIRLRRTGKRNAACHRIVVADERSPRDGRFIEIIGLYDPRHENEKIDLAKAESWCRSGAQPSETVVDIINRADPEFFKKIGGAYLRFSKSGNDKKAAPKA